MKKLIVAVALLLTVVSAADARPRHHHRAHHGASKTVEYHSEARPRQCYGIPWCGCWLRLQKGINDAKYNLAAHWHNFGSRVAGPVVGAIARFNHHVGIVVGVTGNGDPIVKSGNHNHRVATAVYPKSRVIEYRL